MASNIGIKIANGDFYPIMAENSSVKKRLVLTTVHDKQLSVQIDLYRSTAGVLADAQYIGSLVVENIKPKKKGEPSIEMVISSSSNGNITADAVDLDASAAGQHYRLDVSLKSLDETARDMDLPDFELESNEEPPSGLYNHAKRINQNEEKRSSKAWVFIVILLLLLGLAAAWLFLFGGLETLGLGNNDTDNVASESTVEPQPERQPQPIAEPETREPVPPPVFAEPERQQEIAPPPVVAAPPAPPPAPPPVITAPPAPPPPRPQTNRDRPLAPVASYNVPATIPREGVDYRIRWGDTLWDISDAFYRDPWLYPRIARHNNIRNPDLIISGRTISVPPRN